MEDTLIFVDDGFFRLVKTFSRYNELLKTCSKWIKLNETYFDDSESGAKK